MIREVKKGGLSEARCINSVIISGWVAFEPTSADYTCTAENGARLNFKIKTDGVSKTPQIFRAIAWGKRAQEYYTLCHKDDYVLVQGELRKNTWVDNRDVVHDEAEIVVSKLDLLE